VYKRQEYDDLAYKFALLGATDQEIADFLEVSKATINNWKKDYPSFLDSLKKGKEKADAEVSEKLFKRAKGYKYREVKKENVVREGVEILGIERKTTTVKEIPPDVTACIFWLKNRRKENWRDKFEHKVEIEPSEIYSEPEEK